jgi:hypothetical protein
MDLPARAAAALLRGWSLIRADRDKTFLRMMRVAAWASDDAFEAVMSGGSDETAAALAALGLKEDHG